MALPDFILPITVDGERAGLVARDVPTHVFFYKFPVQTRLEEYTDKTEDEVRGLGGGVTPLDWLAWAYQLLAHVVVAPRLRLTDVYAMGEAWVLPFVLYCRTVGWVVPGTEKDGQLARLLRQHPENIPTRAHLAARRPHRAYRRSILLKTYVAQSGEDITGVVRVLAQSYGTQPARVWSMPISEFIYSLHTREQERVNQLGAVPPSVASSGGYGEIVI